MHEIMVKPLPPQCRLTAIFDVSQVNNMIWLGNTLTIVCSLAILGPSLVCRPWFDAFSFLIMNFPIEDLPYLVCMLFPTALSRFDVLFMQYDSNGAVKPFGYMDGPWVLHEKASYANVVSMIFSDQALPCNIPIGLFER
jgi:hypothetical protein